ncbi:CLUMA_CG008811, isoform A [Clunio marinus]|uniref:CLUMA_CG008811, isoform A n=1 Tax=Clunio marinus TaxID=568069 RepID=A0A1J1I524_9DIPT|nr:CLUMA_CG008811, isoform A [Clunio marinus]
MITNRQSIIAVLTKVCCLMILSTANTASLSSVSKQTEECSTSVQEKLFRLGEGFNEQTKHQALVA